MPIVPPVWRMPTRRATLQPRPMNGILVAMIVMNCDVGVERQRGHLRDGAADQLDVDGRLGLARGHRRGGVADVDLPARDVVRAAFERERLGQAGDRVLGRRVGDRVGRGDVRGQRAVVDDPPAAARSSRGTRPGRTGTRRSGSCPRRAASPRSARSSTGARDADAGVVEQQVDGRRRPRTARDRRGIGDVGRDDLRRRRASRAARASRRPASTSSQPSACSARAAARPMPEPAPVTTAITRRPRSRPRRTRAPRR